MTRSRINKDRLSDLCDSIILHILSFLNTKQAFQTCILSKRWKNIAKHLPILRLYPSHFKSLANFRNSVSLVLSLRDHSTTLHTVDFMDSDAFIEPYILKSIVEYAVSHNVRFLRTTITCDLQRFSPCLFSSQTLTFVDLCVRPAIAARKKILFPNSLNLPALTTLTLRSFYFCTGYDGCAEPFSVFKKLNNLVIEDCRLLDTQILCISSTTLVNLTVDESECYRNSYICKLFTPSLCNLNYLNTLNQKLCRSHLCSFKHVYIDINKENTRISLLLNLLQELANIKSLTVSSKTLEVLSSVPDLLKVKLTSLYNLESLRVKMNSLSTPLYEDHGSIKFYFPKRVWYFLLQNSPSASKNVDFI